MKGIIISGQVVIESTSMVEDGEPYSVARSWRERLFSLPFRPFDSCKLVTPKVPAKYSYRLPNGSWVMHPEMAKILRLGEVRPNKQQKARGFDVIETDFGKPTTGATE